MSVPDGSRAFVLGFDGMPWSLLEQWIDDGELPNFRRLSREGAAGPLASTVPANTPIAWPTIATGTRADRHGLYEFMHLDSGYRQRPNTSNDLERPCLWEMLSPAAVANVPMTYPPGDVDGEMVTGMMTPSLDERFAHPPELESEIRERIPEYRIGLDWSDYVGKDLEFRRDVRELTRTRRDLMRMLMDREEWRLLFFVYTAPDRLQHLLWDESVLLDHYRLLDEILGEVIEFCTDGGYSLFVVSDHGFGPVEKTVNVNAVLRDEGLLAAKDDRGTRRLLSAVGVDKDRLLGALRRVGLDEEALVRLLPRSVVDSVADRVPGEHNLYDIDPGETRAFLQGMGSVFVNDAERFEQGTVSDREPTKQAVLDSLGGLEDPETGEQVLVVRDGAELYPRDEGAPDVVVDARPGYRISSRLAADRFSPPGEKVADHRREGVFLALGPAIEAGSTPEGATLADIAPTVLHTVGAPVPDASDGRVLEELYAPSSAAADTPATTAEYGTAGDDGDLTDDFGEVEDRLRGLGYVE
jgi:predicted AlkP superfamily phosphohydrolase/phosphomutase